MVYVNILVCEYSCSNCQYVIQLSRLIDNMRQYKDSRQSLLVGKVHMAIHTMLWYSSTPTTDVQAMYTLMCHVLSLPCTYTYTQTLLTSDCQQQQLPSAYVYVTGSKSKCDTTLKQYIQSYEDTLSISLSHSLHFWAFDHVHEAVGIPESAV